MSLQCITGCTALSEVPVWPIFDFRFWGQMTPKVKIFEKVVPDSAMGHRTMFRDQKWKSAVAKLPKDLLNYTHKNSDSAGLVPAPILPKMGQSCPKFSERCHPLTCPRKPNLVWNGCALPDLFRKDWFFGPKSNYNIGFEPTINNNLCVINNKWISKQKTIIHSLSCQAVRHTACLAACLKARCSLGLEGWGLGLKSLAYLLRIDVLIYLAHSHLFFFVLFCFLNNLNFRSLFCQQSNPQ